MEQREGFSLRRGRADRECLAWRRCRMDSLSRRDRQRTEADNDDSRASQSPPSHNSH